MTMINISLPDEVARLAEQAGLLSDSAIQALLEDALRRRAGRALMEIADRIETTDLPPMTEADIVAEVHAFRAERRLRDAGGA